MCIPGRKGSIFILCEEKSESRRGLHKRRRIALIVRAGGIYPAAGSKNPVKPLYSVGEAYEILIEGSKGDELYVQIDLTMNPRKRVKGYISIYDANGNVLIRAKYEKLKLRLSKGSSKYGKLVEQVARHLNIPYKNVNWMSS
ncbi:MAG: hypothetical protein QXQ57_02850 [Sulfolobales archaeon]